MLQMEAIEQNITIKNQSMLSRPVYCVASTHLKSKPLTKQLRACLKGLKKSDYQKEKDQNTNDINFDRANYIYM